ncbi:toprim domain-containing protein [Mariniflexile gromovii]|uniref:Toprim domain-containing protein n=1 Tax=Mariniflexile gromovii TaxID=362523 RepID=A0ABS4BU92_9FLAO|nr:toprim domain-containing protein [Mariniflexile gromovii]MBP0904132.1 toprim domain-containing protein [Mariniflexile gromovii]
MKRKINCETARNFSVEKALEKLGHFPKRTTEQEAWFLSPWRSETQASLKVSRTKNRWYDHGEGIGGNVIDLVCRILRCTIKEALSFLDNNNSIGSIKRQPFDNTLESLIQIIEVKELEHSALLQYISLRGIAKMVAKTYCKEVWYRYKEKIFFAVGLKNHKNGWELRNRLFKNSSSPKSYTYIQNKSKQLILLEGMFDLLSLAMLDAELLNTSDILVLNSLAFIRDAEKYFETYNLVHLYLDRDAAGLKATKYIIDRHKHVLDKSNRYENHKDLNDLLNHEKGR